MSLWPSGHGALTLRGMMRSYNLGRWIRSHYNIFLPELYSPKDFYIRSTDMDRTIMSSQTVLAGLYPPKGPQIWNQDIMWQPIAVHTVPAAYDSILYIGRHGIGKNCKKFKKLYDGVVKSDFFKAINVQHTNYFNEMSKLTGWKIDDVNYFARLQSALYCYSNHNQTYLPPWSRCIDYDKLNYMAGLNYVRYTFTADLKRLCTGLFFYYIITYFERFAENITEETPRFLMLMGHEFTLVSIMNVMDVFDYRVPEYGSNIIWELRKNRKTYFVNILYQRNPENSTIQKLKMKNCGFDCSLENFKKILGPIILNSTEWDKECKEA